MQRAINGRIEWSARLLIWTLGGLVSAGAFGGMTRAESTLGLGQSEGLPAPGDSRTGTLSATIDDRALDLATFEYEEGNTAAWMPLDDGTYSVFVNAYPDSSFSLRGAVSIRLVMESLNEECPCTPTLAVIRHYLREAADADFYESRDVVVTLSQVQRIDAENLRIEGTFSGGFEHQRRLGGRGGKKVAAEGRFEATAGRVRQ
jgi:hypothetical protein